MTPNEAILKENWQKIWFSNNQNVKPLKKPIFTVGESVRISRKSYIFSRGFLAGWSEEIFYINSIDIKDTPTLYILNDYNKEIIKGRFYEQELQSVNQETFPIEKIYKKVGNQHLVKFLGYPNKFWTNEIVINNK
jgi:hypothetical protein